MWCKLWKHIQGEKEHIQATTMVQMNVAGNGFNATRHTRKTEAHRQIIRSNEFGSFDSNSCRSKFLSFSLRSDVGIASRISNENTEWNASVNEEHKTDDDDVEEEENFNERDISNPHKNNEIKREMPKHNEKNVFCNVKSIACTSIVSIEEATRPFDSINKCRIQNDDDDYDYDYLLLLILAGSRLFLFNLLFEQCGG